MSSEVDLLERLTGEDADLYECLVGSVYAFRDLEHAKGAVHFFIKSCFVELFDNSTDSKSAIPFYDARWLIQIDENWEKGTVYYLRLTDKGYDQFVKDSKNFFDKLFSEG